MKLYSRDFFKWMQIGSRSSAQEIVPLICELIKPKRIIDLGCGTGEWLTAFKQYGAQKVLGVDNYWCEREFLTLSNEEFLVHDIKTPLALDETFDLAITLEAIHHVPQEDAPKIIESLTRFAPIILFSAPIPYQGSAGIRVNEQWPKYWAGLFRQHDFFVLTVSGTKFGTMRMSNGGMRKIYCCLFIKIP